LVTHEFVHIAHLDTSSGVPELFNKIFGLGNLGKIYSPNVIQPRWIIEGIATFYESDLGSQGRDRFAQFEMYLRMAVLEGRIESLSQVTNGSRIFPYGSSVYLYGLHFMKYLVLTYGRETFTELSKLYGSRLIPFGINRALEDIIGVGFDELWVDFLAASRRTYEAQARQIRTHGLRQGRRLTFSTNAATSRNHTRYPVWTEDDEWIYFFEDDGHSRPGIRRVPRRGARVREGVGIGAQGEQDGVERVFSAPQATPISFVGDGPEFVFDMLGVHDLRYRWSDLYRWAPGADPLDGAEQLTVGLRAREPHVSPDGRTVVFARNDVAQSRLGFLDLRTKRTTEVGPSERYQQVYTPRFSPDGRSVVYGAWHDGGYRDIYLYDVATQTSRALTRDRASDQAPCWSPDGRTVFFSSDRTGVFNIYAADVENGTVWQVTNVLGGAFECAVSHDGATLAYVGFTASGFDLWSMPLAREEWTPAMNGDMDYPVAPVFGADRVSARTTRGDGASMSSVGSVGVTPSTSPEPSEPPTSRRYRPLKTMFPRVIMPTAFEFSSSDFLTDIGVSTELSDVVGLHRLSGTFRWLLDYARPAGSVQWTWRRPFPTFSAAFGRTFRVRGGYDRYLYSGEDSQLYLASEYLERSTQATAGLVVPIISHPVHRANASFDYRFTRYDNLDATTVVDPNAPVQSPPEVGDLAGATMRLSYSNTRTNQFSYYAETGRRVSMAVSVFDEALGGDFRDLQARLTYSEFIPMPWRGHQVLALRASGGASAGGLERRGAYSLGGISEQQDQLRLFLTRTAISEAGSLRGYPSGVFRGRYFGLLNVEYRIPLVDVERGIGAVPMYVQNIVFVPFTDWGRAWTDPIRWRDVSGSVGASLIFSFRVGYGERVDLFFQYARGLDADIGLDTFRVMVARSF
jgi:Tol biopolymer transport system component